MKKIIEKIFLKTNLDLEESQRVMGLILEGEASNEQTAVFLGALQVKGVTTNELVGFLKMLMSYSRKVDIAREDVIDVCGTGGDKSGSFNISTATAFVVAGAGGAVAKHGNRSVSSLCGSADVLEALGIKIGLTTEKTVKCVEDIGFGFFFAPDYHPILAKVSQIRKSIGVPTMFNLLGPLANPARVKRQLLGVYDSAKTELLAEVLRDLKSIEAMVVCSSDGLDEFSLSQTTKTAHLFNGQIKTSYVKPEDFGFHKASVVNLIGGDAKKNAQIIVSVLAGEKGDKRDTVVINASAALVIAGRAKNFFEGTSIANEAIDSGNAFKILEKLRKVK